MFHRFISDISHHSLPEKFTFPFYYEPHPIALAAAAELQEELKVGMEIDHNFGLEAYQEGMVIGKMFGVLVVRNSDEEIGYLKAFSGKLADRNHHEGYVPPVYDMLTERSFFKQEEEILNLLNGEVEELEKDPDYLDAKITLQRVRMEAEGNIGLEKKKLKEGKTARKLKREKLSEGMPENEKAGVLEELSQQSIRANYRLRDVMKHWKVKVNVAEQKYRHFHQKLVALKMQRRERSAALQEKLFHNYTFLNALQEEASLLDIFKETAMGRPPAGAGECAAPKLLQHAFLNDLEPVALAEFWWGASPSAEVRAHGNFYPACIGKCKPILTHMLSATETDEDPLLKEPKEDFKLEVVYEDEELLVLNKPVEFLSVPGRNIKDSVQARMKQRFPGADGPLVVHRLDMSTSGLMLIAKSLWVYKNLQRQFSDRTVRKRYVALLEGILFEEAGTIELPLALDYNDRPRQRVSYEEGKPARTRWKKVNSENGRTRVYFYPETGRTHQLRVHAAHHSGLNTPIVGDDLYGKRDKRLMLHAEKLEFIHPVSKRSVTVTCNAPF